jgi:hypothetical protein
MVTSGYSQVVDYDEPSVPIWTTTSAGVYDMVINSTKIIYSKEKAKKLLKKAQSSGDIVHDFEEI